MELEIGFGEVLDFAGLFLHFGFDQRCDLEWDQLLHGNCRSLRLRLERQLEALVLQGSSSCFDVDVDGPSLH